MSLRLSLRFPGKLRSKLLNSQFGWPLPTVLCGSLAACGLTLFGMPIAALASSLAATCAAMFAWKRGVRTVSHLERAASDLSAKLGKDALTGLLNRSAFQSALNGTQKNDGGLTIVLFFDLDRFKEVNDTLGHRVGDLLLIEVASRIAAVLTDESCLARLGGDEFAAILKWDLGLAPAELCQKLIAEIARPFEIEGSVVKVGTSIGVAIGDPAVIDGGELLRRADIAMYAAKADVSIKYRIFDDILDNREMKESAVRIEIGRALIEEQFELHFQPLVDARTGKIDSAEALLRAQAPALRDVPTSQLIAIAEASGQVLPLTAWTIEVALDAIHTVGNLPVAVNISPVFFRQANFVPQMVDRLLARHVKPDRLILEVTEGVLIENLDAAQHSLARLREIGVKVHLDDFGTGYSSLSYLQHFDLDGLKLDRSFLRNLGEKKRSNQIIRSMIDFGHSLDLRVIVEGVESEWQKRLLQLLGADVLQGFEIGMPMTINDLAVFQALNSEAGDCAGVKFLGHAAAPLIAAG